MNRHVNAIAGRLSLRPPQRRSLEILDRITEIAPPKKGADTAAVLAAIRGEFPSVTDFEREFPSLCFALATGVGKTRLMGAFISYLHLAHGINNFFVLAPNLTIYNKLIADFTPNTPKYVFKGIAEFATDAPEIITGDNYEARARTLFDELIRCKVNIFNISKINSEVRGGKGTAHQAAVGVHRRELLRLPGRAAGPRAAHGRVAPLPGQRWCAGDQRAEADSWAGTDGHPVRRDREGRYAVQERHLRLSARQGDGRRLRQGAGGRDPQELQPGGHVSRRDRAPEARRRHPAARERQGRAGNLSHARPKTRSSNRSYWSSRATRRTRASCWR